MATSKETQKAIARYLGQNYRDFQANAVEQANRVHLTAITSLFTLSGGGIGLLAVQLNGTEDDFVKGAALSTIALLFLSIACGILQLDSNQRFLMKNVERFRDLFTNFGLYEFTENQSLIDAAQEKLKESSNEPADEKFFRGQIALFFIAALWFMCTVVFKMLCGHDLLI